MKKILSFLPIFVLLFSTSLAFAQPFAKQTTTNKTLNMYIYTDHDDALDSFKEIQRLVQEIPIGGFSLDKAGVFYRYQNRIVIVPNLDYFGPLATMEINLIIKEFTTDQGFEAYKIQFHYDEKTFPFANRKEMIDGVLELVTDIHSSSEEFKPSQVLLNR